MGEQGRLTSEQGAGLRGSEGIITGGDPDQERVLGGILQTEVSQLSSSLGYLQSQTYDDSVIVSVCVSVCVCILVLLSFQGP